MVVSFNHLLNRPNTYTNETRKRKKDSLSLYV